MKTIIVEKLSNELKEFVTNLVREVLNDSDLGLSLSNEANKRLQEARDYRGKNITSSEIKEKYY